MLSRIRETLSIHRKKVLPSLITMSLLAGIVVSIVVSPNAQADYTTGCGYGYSSSASGFGHGSGIGYGYGYLSGGSFGYGYGNEVCPLAISTASLPAGTVGTSYSQPLSGTGGTGSYTWINSGSLPGGLVLSSGGTISGTPNAAGTFPFTVTMTDGNGQTTTGALSISIASGGGGGGSTTTTSTTTTSTTPTSTTTTPPHKVCRLHAIRVNGFARVGRTVTVTITGTCFYGKPRITSNEAGTRAVVIHDRGRVLVVRVTVRARSPKGWYTFTIRLANGKSCRVNYLVK